MCVWQIVCVTVMIFRTQNDANTYSMMVAVKEYQLYSSSAVVGH